VTGNTTINGWGTVQAGTQRIVRFTGTPTITHNATSNILPGGANIVAAAGDFAGLTSKGGGNWECNWYTRALVPPLPSGSLFNMPGGSTLTIASDAITVTGGGRYFIDTEGAAATDNLSTINGGNVGDIVILSDVSSARDVTIKNGTGNISCGADRTNTALTDMIMLMKYNSSSWVMLTFADNA
jgi:hypothetical protein